ncbi:Hypothetical protein HVR_LOCUS481 [uncultured virus]|nr:Hypothetical protein HVR_LOCUS481 [uncultured virus]
MSTLSTPSFTIITRDLTTVIGKAALNNMRAHVTVSCASCNPGRYTDYSDDQIKEAFDNTNLMFEIYMIDPENAFNVPSGLALIDVQNRVATIKLLFTLPAGKGHMLITKILAYARSYFSTPNVDTIYCNSYNFSWITGSCIAHHFVKCEGDSHQYRTTILHFNQHEVKKLSSIPELKKATGEQIKMEQSFEHSPYDPSHGPLYQAFIKNLLDSSVITEDELKRSRSDVRTTILRPGQSSNPLGIHGDFTPREPGTNLFYNPDPNQTLKIIVVSSGSPGTKVYTKPINVPICTNEWTHVWREAQVQNAVVGTNAKYFETESGCPVVFTEMQMHEAQALEARHMSNGETASARVFMRLIIYPKSRKSEVPTEAASSLPQVYIKNIEM